MKLQWSKYFQNPDFLEYSRMFFICPEFEPLICNWCNLQKSNQILDVGCGTGFFTRILKKNNPQANFTGLDIEKEFILRAREESKNAGLSIKFLQGDAENLPFEDNFFDLVVSHTFLTSAPNPKKSFDEMKRVLKSNGRIASITSMSFMSNVQSKGKFDKNCAFLEEFFNLANEIFFAYNKIIPFQKYTEGLKSTEIPNFFAAQGLKNISVYPLGRFFSLSNAAIPFEQKKRWLELYQRSEIKKIEIFMSLSEAKNLLDEKKAERYKELLKKKCAFYLANPEENFIWEWQGGANILVTGDKI